MRKDDELLEAEHALELHMIRTKHLSRLSSAERRALQVIIDTDLAWTFNARLANAGVRPETLAGLEADGWVVRWPTPKGLAWTLAPWGAQMLNQVIVEEGRAENPRWGDPEEVPDHVLIDSAAGVERLWFPDELVDRNPTPEQVVEFFDEVYFDEASNQYFLKDPDSLPDEPRPATVMGRPAVFDVAFAMKQRAKRSRRRRAKERGLESRRHLSTASSRLAS
jgi:hypothetical protein